MSQDETARLQKIIELAERASAGDLAADTPTQLFPISSPTTELTHSGAPF